MILVVAAIVPKTSLLGHLCGVAVGYIGNCFACRIHLSYYPLMQKRSWPRLCQVHRASGMGSSLGRITVEPTCKVAALCERGP